ncbi:hypothetical protein ACQP1V_27060 [Microtetraspora malaysiensis]|uniref:hypothetical protein n=1 Tax=Microtetraspora malaysiensis TaxID=161358 RepID=UPI003D8DBC28
MIIADLAMSLALDGDSLADIAMLRSEPELFGHVAVHASQAAWTTSGVGAIRALHRSAAICSFTAAASSPVTSR